MTNDINYSLVNQKRIKKVDNKIAKLKDEDEKDIYIKYKDDLNNMSLNDAKKNLAINKSKRKRKQILTYNLFKVAAIICLPIALYGLFNSFYNLIDSIICSSISASSVTKVAALAQVKNALAAFGAGIAGGGAIIVARHYGAGDLKSAKKYSAVLLSIIFVVSLLIILVLTPLSDWIVRLASVGADDDSIMYFRLQLLELAIVAINTMYFGLEKAKGNSKNIMYLNILVLLVKMLFTVMFVYALPHMIDGFRPNIFHIEISTILGQSALLIIAIFTLFSKRNILRINIKELSLRWKYVKQVLFLAVPIFLGKFIMSLGKVVVNSMCGEFYGLDTGGHLENGVVVDSLIVGALAVSNNLTGLCVNPTNAFEEGGSTIISQNLGAKNMRRAMRAFIANLIWVAIISISGYILITFVFQNQLINIFNYKPNASAEELEKTQNLIKYIKEIYIYDSISIIGLGFTAAVLGLLYGFGQTYLSGILNFSRIGIRILTLLVCKFWIGMDYRAAGVSMGVSNVLILLLSVVFLIIFRMRVKKHGYNGMYFTDAEPELVELKEDDGKIKNNDEKINEEILDDNIVKKDIIEEEKLGEQ